MSMSEYSLSDLAAASGGGGFGGENSWVLIILFALIFGFGGGGLFGNGNGATAASTADIQRAVDLNAIQQGQADISANIQRGIYEINGATKDAAYNNLSEIRDVQAAVATGNANIVNNLTALGSQMQNCCCETKQTIMENRYLDSQNASAIMANSTANAQKILDAISTNRINDLQAQVSELKTQNMFCGVPRISPYGYNVVPAFAGGYPGGSF